MKIIQKFSGTPQVKPPGNIQVELTPEEVYILRCICYNVGGSGQVNLIMRNMAEKLGENFKFPQCAVSKSIFTTFQNVITSDNVPFNNNPITDFIQDK